MGILVLDERHTADLRFLQEQPPAVLSEFVKIALGFLREGAKERLFTSAAKQLEVDVSTVKAAVEGLAQLFVRAARRNLSEQDFVDTLLVVGFSPEVIDELKELFDDSREELRLIEAEQQVDLPHLANMEWRLDVQLASRSLQGQLNPVYVTRWDIEKDGVIESQVLQLSYTNLKHVADELEAALKELRGAHVRRVMRNVK